MKFFIDMTDEELEQVDLVEFTKLKVGDRVRHANEGKMYCPKVGTLGTIVKHHNMGLHHWGGLCVVVDVLFDGDTESVGMVYTLALKAA